jgi:hypothetical protein
MITLYDTPKLNSCSRIDLVERYARGALRVPGQEVVPWAAKRAGVTEGDGEEMGQCTCGYLVWNLPLAGGSF